MKLSEFKQGDIIHRLKPVIIESSNGWMFSGKTIDRSFIESPIKFIAIKSGLLFYEYVDEPAFENKPYNAGIDRYGDDNWDYFPTEYLETTDLKN